jgi:hypothetical protein
MRRHTTRPPHPKSGDTTALLCGGGPYSSAPNGVVYGHPSARTRTDAHTRTRTRTRARTRTHQSAPILLNISAGSNLPRPVCARSSPATRLPWCAAAGEAQGKERGEKCRTVLRAAERQTE